MLGELVSGDNSWAELSQTDQIEFFALKKYFNTYKKPYGKDVRSQVFRRELFILLSYIDKDLSKRASKCKIIGISFLGPFICTNTSLLANFIGRSKSSINAGLQQLGLFAVKDKNICRQVLGITMPQLTGNTFMKQWSVRAVSENSPFCYLTRFTSPLTPSLNKDVLDKPAAAEEPQLQGEPIYVQEDEYIEFDFSLLDNPFD